MTLIPITATPSGLTLACGMTGARGMTGPGAQDSAPEPVIARALQDLPAHAPVLVMIHGKGYSPADPAHDPHALIFAPRAGHGRSRFVSWPRRLGFALPGPRQPLGLCIALGWDASGSIWTATRSADDTALKLARLIQAIRRADPGRRIDLIGHSLGARVILGAVPMLAAGSLGRILLLAGADFLHRAAAAQASYAGQTCEFFNITTRENDLYDFLFERALAPLGGQRALGHGLGHGLGKGQATAGGDNWLDIQLDHPGTAQALRGLGLPLAPPRARICHWSVYLRPGVFRVYRALIHDRQRTEMARLRRALDAPAHPRWSRIAPALARQAGPATPPSLC